MFADPYSKVETVYRSIQFAFLRQIFHIVNTRYQQGMSKSLSQPI